MEPSFVQGFDMFCSHSSALFTPCRINGDHLQVLNTIEILSVENKMLI